MSTPRDPVTGRFTSALDNALKLATGIIGLCLVSRLVMPGNHTAAMIQAQGEGFRMMVKVAIAERAIEERNVPRVEQLLGAIDDEVMTELFAGLNDMDLDWVESHLLMRTEE